jgi:hypothetical protein
MRRCFDIPGRDRSYLDVALDAAGRDRAVRWGADTETAAMRARAEAAWSEHVASGGATSIRDAFDRGLDVRAREIREKWHRLREDAEALRAACLSLTPTESP